MIRATWPRLVGAGTAGHDAVLWAHLQETRAAEARQAQPSREVLDEVEAACQLLRDAGGGTVSPLAAA